MSLRIDLDGEPRNKGHVFVYDKAGNLRLKMWFYGNGEVTYREFDEKGNQIHGLTSAVLVSPGEQHWKTIPTG